MVTCGRVRKWREEGEGEDPYGLVARGNDTHAELVALVDEVLGGGDGKGRVDAGGLDGEGGEVGDVLLGHVEAVAIPDGLALGGVADTGELVAGRKR